MPAVPRLPRRGIAQLDALEIDVTGTVPDTEYWQLNVVGEVDLGGVPLVLIGTPTLTGGESFIVVANDGVDPIIGTFAGLVEGGAIPDFLGSGRDATISYVGGDGNDVVLTVANNPPIAVPDSYTIANVQLTVPARESWPTTAI